VTYAVPGHPCIGEETVRLIRERAAASGMPVTVIGSASFVEASLAAAGVSLSEPLLIVDALRLSGMDLPAACTSYVSMTDAALLLYQVYDAAAASAAKLALLETRPDDLEVTVVQAAGVPGKEHVERIPLRLLDRIHADHLTTVYVPAVPPEQRTRSFADLVGVMSRLRGEGGCPWDRKQDHRTLRKWLLEECYEAVEAIDNDDLANLCDELGDVLLQIVFHAQVATESGAFTIADVIEAIVTKLIRRHPHVFGDGDADSPEAVVRNWEAIKATERGDRPAPESALDGVPVALPALNRAQEMGERAARVGFDWPDVGGVMAKIAEELEEIRDAVQSGDRAAVEREIGDMLFAVVNLARWTEVDAEEALRTMLGRFAKRFRHIEAEAARSGRAMSAMTIEELDALWERAKRGEG
jgi:tetrapyrrole methylase family protein/MazG family protein